MNYIMSSYITSIDVGIKNISYCTLSYNPYGISGNQYPILQWDDVDLIGAKQLKTKNPICKSKLGNGSSCKHPAHWYYQINKTESTASKALIKTEICKLHAGHLTKSNDNIHLTRLFTPTNIELSELTTCLVEKFDQLDFSQSTQIIIELQPKMATQKMKDFSKVIMAYFIIRYMSEKKNNSLVENVQFISASNKLTVYDGPYVECHLKDPYSRNKFYGKIYCQYLIRNNSRWTEYLQSYPKQDDLSDCFLQGVWYLLSNDAPKTTKNLLKTDQTVNMSQKLKLTFKKTCLIPDEDDTIKNENETIKNENASSQPLKLKLKFKTMISGQEKLLQIKNNKTTRTVVTDSNYGKYKKLRRGYKPKPNQKNFTLSNIKYVFEKDVKKEYINLPEFISSVEFYFDSVENFKQLQQKIISKQ